MNPHFRDVLEALRESADAMVRAHGALGRAIESAIAANDEHNDLRESVERLETIVLAQTADIQALRAEVAALKNGGR